jgi:hypothetical protein
MYPKPQVVVPENFVKAAWHATNLAVSISGMRDGELLINFLAG